MENGISDQSLAFLKQKLGRRQAISLLALSVAACGGGSDKPRITSLVGESSPQPPVQAEAVIPSSSRPPSGFPTVSPGPAWTGIGGSGFQGAPPADPKRQTAKPVARLLEPPRQAFTDQITIAVTGAANDSGSLLNTLGILKVVAHFEGAQIEIDAPSFRTFSDANMEWRSYFGWWLTLEKPPQLSGEAQLYLEVVPRDGSMQNRVIGPFSYFPVEKLYDYDINIDSTIPEITGQSYQSFLTAFAYLRNKKAKNPRITVVNGREYDLATPSVAYQFDGYCTIEASSQVTLSKPAPDQGDHFRPRHGPLRFKGSNIILDFVRSSELYSESGHHSHWLDGIRLTNSAGRGSLRFKSPRNGLAWLVRGRPWMTECNATNLWRAGASCSLVRGCNFSNTWDDLLSGTSCAVDNRIDGHDSSFYRSYIDALTLHYTGSAQTATIEMSGSNGAAERVISVKADGIVIGTFRASRGKDAFNAGTNFNVRNVVDWLNTLTGVSASLLDDRRHAVSLQARGTIGPWGPVKIASAPVTLPTFFDVHADIFQTTGDNVFISGNIGSGVNAQVVFLKDHPTNDYFFGNNAFANSTPVGDLSQLADPQSHVMIVHNTLSSQRMAMRADLKYRPDRYCLIANNALPQLVWAGTIDQLPSISDNHLQDGASNPLGAGGTTISGNASTLFENASAGAFSPRGQLLANTKKACLRYDANGRARQTPFAPVGAFAS